MIPGAMVKGPGGAIDLVSGATPDDVKSKTGCPVKIATDLIKA